MKQLLEFYLDTGSERVGFILDDESVIEVKNVCHDPENGFEVSPEDIVAYSERAIATWHTHPGANSNLSVDDYIGFRNFPDLRHYIVGQDGVQAYVVRNGKVFHDG